jgi:hypothetical protein
MKMVLQSTKNEFTGYFILQFQIVGLVTPTGFDERRANGNVNIQPSEAIKVPSIISRRNQAVALATRFCEPR